MRKMFSENQVKELIKQAIASGEISVGSLLIHHTIQMVHGDDQAEVHALSKRNEAYTLESLLSDLGNGDVILTQANDTADVTASPLYHIYGDSLILYYVLDDSSLDSLTIDDTYTITDTFRKY